MGLRGLFKRAFSVVSLLVGMVLGANVDKLIETTGADSLLTTLLGDHAKDLVALASSHWFQLVGAAVIAFTLGLWVDSWLLKAAPKGAHLDRYQALGKDAVNLARVCREVITLTLPHDATPELARVASMLTRFEKLRFPVPPVPPELSPNEKLGIAATYLVGVGQFLMDGHGNEARAMARSMVAQDPGKRMLAARPRNGMLGDRA